MGASTGRNATRRFRAQVRFVGSIICFHPRNDVVLVPDRPVGCQWGADGSPRFLLTTDRAVGYVNTLGGAPSRISLKDKNGETGVGVRKGICAQVSHGDRERNDYPYINRDVGRLRRN